MKEDSHPSMVSDEELITRYSQGDEKAISDLINRYLKSVYNFIFRFTGSRKDAEDITQETFFKAWRSLKKYHHRTSFKTWLFTIARNTSIDWLRKKKNFVFSDFENAEGENPLTDSLTDPAPLPSELFRQIENKKILDRVLEQLSPLYREILFLHYHEELTFLEIGTVLGKSLNTVKSQHRRALFALRKLLDAPP